MLTKLKVLYGAANIQVLYGAAALTFSLLLVAVVCAACTRRRAPGWNAHGRHTKLPADEEEQFTESTAPLPVTELTEESATISGHAKPVDHRAVRIVQAPLHMLSVELGAPVSTANAAWDSPSRSRSSTRVAACSSRLCDSCHVSPKLQTVT